MSAAKRRVKRKIARLVRMDINHHLCQMRWCRSNSERQATAARILAAMKALGRTIDGDVKDRAIAAINKSRAEMGSGRRMLG